jgi:hypothetical protein
MVPRGLMTTIATARQRRAPPIKQGRVQAPLEEVKDAVRTNTSCLHAADVASPGNFRESSSSRDLLVSSSKCFISNTIQFE